MRALLTTLGFVTAFAMLGCDRSPSSPSAGTATQNRPAADAPTPAEGPAQPGHGGAVIELGVSKIGDLTVRASRDEGALTPGGDAPIDVWFTTPEGQPASVSAVRFWIGPEDAKGSIKAKADIENPNEPNHWHTHAEAPDPLPAGSRLWVEIELAGGARSSGGFDLKQERPVEFAGIVEAACASCIFKMPDVQGCKLAIKIDGKPYLVTGASVDAHKAGLCSAAQKADVRGRIEGDRFVATKFDLVK